MNNRLALHGRKGRIMKYWNALAEQALMAAFYGGLILGIVWAVTVLGAVVLSLLSVWRYTFSSAPVAYLLMHIEHSIVIGSAVAVAFFLNHRRHKRWIRTR
ncbi:MAG: hypothetical protein ACLFNQ_05990 [Spirochaetaceae bacterium]